MPTALQPMSTGQVLDRTFNLYRNNFMLFAGIATIAAATVVVSSLLLVLFGVATPTMGAKFDPGTLILGLVISVVIFGLLYLTGISLATGATIYAVSKVHLGHIVTIQDSYKTVLPLLGRIMRIVFSVFLRMLGVIVLSYLLLVLIMMVLIPAMALSRGGPPNIAATIGLGIMIIIVLFAAYVWALRTYCKYSFAVPACLLEKMGAAASMKRSAFLSKSMLFRIFLVYLLTGIISVVFSLALQYSVGLLLSSVPFVAIVWQFVATFLSATLAFPIGTIAISLLYYDQRVRKEAFDLQLMMESLGQGDSQQAAAAAPIG